MTRLQPKVLSIGDIFGSDTYVIPVYQRAYAWAQDQIETLLQDVHDYRDRGASGYYIGSLVTHAHPSGDGILYEVVDGQQRLTTLYIILCTLTDRGSELRHALTFEGRSRSSADLDLLARRGQDCSVDDLQEFGIKVAVETVRSARAKNEFTAEDLRFLQENVQLVRTTLPAGTDLNHYFEVMNSRGEQLEKHEIVKASLMSKLENDPVASRTLAVVWDACSDMSRHVQAKFPLAARQELFGADWAHLSARSFDEVTTALGVLAEGGAQEDRTLKGLIMSRSGSPAARNDAADDELDRYGAIIDFPNFLLHVLALVQPGRTPFTWQPGPSAVPLDDKQLVALFERMISSADQVREFTYALLRARYLFDRYVIKTDRSRESEDDSNWVLLRVRNRDKKLAPISTFVPGAEDESVTSKEHEHVVMLQSMFQVTDSRRSYKNFLFALLEHLYDSPGAPDAAGLVTFLQHLADDRFRTTVGPEDLDQGTSTSHFALNYLDYLLWRRPTTPTSQQYRFRYRSSVEHFYPQNPDPSGNITKLPDELVDQFGNLCLMSRSENSRRSNLTPAAKVSQYKSDQQSLKFQVMAHATTAHGWAVEQIRKHGEDMKALLQAGVESLEDDSS